MNKTIKYAMAGGLLFAFASSCLSQAWGDLFRRILHVASGGSGETADWGEPLFYIILYAIPGALIGVAIGAVVGIVFARRR